MDRATQDRLAAAVGEAEKHTSAEIVIAVASHSGSYRDTDLSAGIIAACLALAAMLFAPVVVLPVLVLPYALIVGLFAAMLTARSEGLRRALSSRKRRRAHVDEAAKVAFVEEGVSTTHARNGVLIYASVLERRLAILPDVGIDGRVPRAPWNILQHELTAQLAGRSHLVAVLEQAIARSAEILREAFPATDDNPDELPNRPRLRP